MTANLTVIAYRRAQTGWTHRIIANEHAIFSGPLRIPNESAAPEAILAAVAQAQQFVIGMLGKERPDVVERLAPVDGGAALKGLVLMSASAVGDIFVWESPAFVIPGASPAP